MIPLPEQKGGAKAVLYLSSFGGPPSPKLKRAALQRRRRGVMGRGIKNPNF